MGIHKSVLPHLLFQYRNCNTQLTFSATFISKINKQYRRNTKEKDTKGAQKDN